MCICMYIVSVIICMCLLFMYLTCISQHMQITTGINKQTARLADPRPPDSPPMSIPVKQEAGLSRAKLSKATLSQARLS